MYFRSLNPQYFINARVNAIKGIFAAFPKRKFILVGDFATPGLTGQYATLARGVVPVQCIFMMDVRADNPANHFCPATGPMHRNGLHERWTVFNNAAEFRNESLAYLRQLYTTNITVSPDIGCGSLLERQTHWNDLAENQHYGTLHSYYITLVRGIVANMQCLMLLGERPHPACRYDRRGGEAD